MSKKVQYEFDITGVSDGDLNALKGIIEASPSVFEDSVMSSFGGDARYTYESDSFKVTEIYDGEFIIEVDVSYFEGCKDKDDCNAVELSVSYEIVGSKMIFELDETVWRTE